MSGVRDDLGIPSVVGVLDVPGVLGFPDVVGVPDVLQKEELVVTVAGSCSVYFLEAAVVIKL